jgi:hypothetical protein
MQLEKSPPAKQMIPWDPVEWKENGVIVFDGLCTYVMDQMSKPIA